jgi:2-hydroxy-3-keto-5-methylthiopentenyl-1-phosphate phosphatase
MSTSVEIFCDFDGTITKGDLIDILLEELADPEWREIEERWVSGKISAQECMATQVPLIRGGWKAILRVLESIEVDPTFAKFARWCKQKSIPLVIGSDSLDKVIHHILRREGITVDNVFANHLVEDTDGSLRLTFPDKTQVQRCDSGICKCRLIDNGPNKPTKIVIGDGRSDFCWANEADLVFAKSQLLTYCQSYRMNYIEFNDFNSIRAELEHVIAPVPQFLPEPQLIPSLMKAV